MKFLKDEKTRRIIVSGSILVVLYFLLNNLSDIYGVFTKLLHVMSPFIVGAAIAYILNVPMRKVERGLFKNPDKFSGPKWHGRRRALAIFITISIAFLVIAAFSASPIYVVAAAFFLGIIKTKRGGKK